MVLDRIMAGLKRRRQQARLNEANKIAKTQPSFSQEGKTKHRAEISSVLQSNHGPPATPHINLFTAQRERPRDATTAQQPSEISPAEKEGFPSTIALRAQLASTQKELVDREQELANAQEDNRKNEDLIFQLQSSLTSLEEQVRAMQSSKLAEGITTTDLVEDYVPESKRDDRYFITKFDEIKIKIREWVVQSFFKPGVRATIGFTSSQDIPQEFFAKLFKGAFNIWPNPRLVDAKLLRCFVQAYVADIVNEFAFNPYLPVECGKCIPELEQWMQGCHASETHSWKTSTLGLITKSERYTQAIHTECLKLALDVTNRLAPLHHTQSASSKFNTHKASRTLATIIRSATSLALELRNEPFTFKTHFCAPGDLCSNSEWPVITDNGKVANGELEDSQQICLFNVFPGLIRQGRGDVETVCLVNASVVIALPDWLPPANL